MNSGLFLDELRDLGAILALTDDGLEIDAPADVLSDERLARLRDQKPALRELLQAEAEYFEERAAVREYDGGFGRSEAETLARADIDQARGRRCGIAYE